MCLRCSRRGDNFLSVARVWSSWRRKEEEAEEKRRGGWGVEEEGVWERGR